MDQQTVRKIAELARIKVNESEVEYYRTALSKIFAMEEKMLEVNTDGVEPLQCSLEMTQPLRQDAVMEKIDRDVLQRIAPSTMAGLYLVPKVIE